VQRSFVRVSRVLNLYDIPQERFEEGKIPEKGWPAKGEIEFKNVFLKYRPNTDTVLNNLTFKVAPGEKIGVVGRTGAGKSTITMALTRIVELEEGKGQIFVDGEDISTLNLNALRGSMTMIPQDPTLFTGTLRHNVDPFEENTDEEIISLFKKAGLEYLFEGKSKKEKEDDAAAKADKKKRLQLTDEELEEKEKKEKEEKEKKKKEKEDKKKDKKGGDEKDDEEDEEEDGKGLKFRIQEEGNNLSVGEKQLVCIVRAILRRNKIVILDEATANIDVVTEQKIQ
jgi:ABC-type multidrug transport system fused ATPase/permease subunit